MKNKFYKNWKASKNPKKQRKYAANAPIHMIKKLVSVNLSKELRKKYGKRNIPLRKGDTVRIMVGKLNKKEGKVNKIKRKSLKVYIEGIQVKKRDGSKADVPFRPSNLRIIELNLDDKKRIKAIERKSNVPQTIDKNNKEKK
ncbi:MAG: 50S ribosomal protein L24 [Nanoarchaeota archaeon]